ncbi:MAG: hydrogenase formation protein HypD [Oscillospiraceae bacterium]|nr:hydrogenase formation protein HypD [Oscillospiraceae bacterium]
MSTIEEARSYLENYDGPDFRIMEVCGTHTHEIFRQGIRRILSPKINLISGPGCPVCVTPVSFIDEAVFLALEKGCTITTFGDLVRVPGSKMSLAGARAKGAKIKVVYAPFDAVKIAQENPEEQVVFLSVGFETTTPSDVIAVKKAMTAGLKNFSILTANKTMPGAYEAMGKSCDAFLYPGHVHAITGTQICKDMCDKGVSGVIAGFTGSELLTALAVAVKKFGEGKPFFVNCYPRVVKDEGSPAAVAMVDRFMEPCDAEWRGIGTIPMSGMQLRDEYAEFDARKKYSVPDLKPEYKTACRCGDVLQGKITPNQCPLFGKACNPDHPVGACMVSDEGACSAFYMYGGDL